MLARFVGAENDTMADKPSEDIVALVTVGAGIDKLLFNTVRYVLLFT
jgi:hypothetical protein